MNIDIHRTASFSVCDTYRHELTRIWENTAPDMTFIMLNPSTADGEYDDPTIRKCIGFAKLQGYGSIHVYNLFDYRATSPADLIEAEDPIGPNPFYFLNRHLEKVNPKIVLAWGAKGTYMGRDAIMIMNLRRRKSDMWCLGKTKEGHPKHPLYVPYSQGLVRFNG